MTRGIQDLGQEGVQKVLAAVRNADHFDPDNDPYGEHDFGAVVVDGIKCFWKIDYYDNDLKYHSPDKSYSTVTQRVLTVMLAEEY